MAFPSNVNDLIKEACTRYLDTVSVTVPNTSIGVQTVSFLSGIGVNNFPLIQTVSVLNNVQLSSLTITNLPLVQTVSILGGLTVSFSDSVIINNNPLIQTVSILGTPFFSSINNPLIQTVSVLNPVQISSLTISNNPGIQTVSFLTGVTVSNQPLIQTVSIFGLPYFNLNNSPLIQTVSFLSGIGVNNFPLIQTVSVLNNVQLSSLTITNLPLVQTVSILGGLTVSFPASQNVIIGNTITSLLLYSGNMVTTISTIFNILGFGEHIFYFIWNGQINNNTRANIEHNFDSSIGGEWSLLIDQRSPSGNTLRTNSFSYKGILGAIRLNLSPANGSGNLIVRSYHRYN